jgi:hypothetical protein
MPKAKTTTFEEEKESDVTMDTIAGPAQLPESRWLDLSSIEFEVEVKNAAAR